jgi:hypothetical protein
MSPIINIKLADPLFPLLLKPHSTRVTTILAEGVRARAMVQDSLSGHGPIDT